MSQKDFDAIMSAMDRTDKAITTCVIQFLIGLVFVGLGILYVLK